MRAPRASAPRSVDAAVQREVRSAEAPLPGLKNVGPLGADVLVPVAVAEPEIEEVLLAPVM